MPPQKWNQSQNNLFVVNTVNHHHKQQFLNWQCCHHFTKFYFSIFYIIIITRNNFHTFVTIGIVTWFLLVIEFNNAHMRSNLMHGHLHMEVNSDEFVYDEYNIGNVRLLTYVDCYTIRVLLKYCVILWNNVIIVVIIAVCWFSKRN